MRSKLPFAIITLLIIMQLQSCAWNRSRKYVNYSSSESITVSGWSFTPIIQSYHFNIGRGMPLEKDGVWLYVKAQHPIVGESVELYGVDIDSVTIIYSGQNEEVAGIKYASAYGDILDDENLVNMFRFRSLAGEDYISIPQEAESITIEFDVVFYKGIYKTFHPSADSDMVRDTVSVNTDNPESFRKRITMKLIRRDSKSLIPAFV